MRSDTEEELRPRNKLRDFEQKVLRTPKRLVKIEKKLVEFPFSKYFIGHKKPDKAKYRPNWRQWSNDELTMAWLGHSMVLINFYGTWILTDPAFSERVGISVLGLLTVGPRRMVTCPLEPNELPPIDLLLISHAHMDHTDIPSLKKLRNARHAIVAFNTMGVYKEVKLRDVRHLDWGDTINYPDLGDLRVEALEVKHAGWRMPWDPCRSRNEPNGFSYNGYLLEKKNALGETHSLVFAGDTGYTPAFKALGDRFRNEGREIDIALMPIGAYNPWIEARCNPEQAWRMTQEMNARKILPIHWNTYMQSSEARFEPIEWLRSAVENDDDIVLSEHGDTWIAS
jgi:L-ascorbate metabolism protein UlaG (beta-lactamase superfamily)